MDQTLCGSGPWHLDNPSVKKRSLQEFSKADVEELRIPLILELEWQTNDIWFLQVVLLLLLFLYEDTPPLAPRQTWQIAQRMIASTTKSDATCSFECALLSSLLNGQSFCVGWICWFVSLRVGCRWPAGLYPIHNTDPCRYRMAGVPAPYDIIPCGFGSSCYSASACPLLLGMVGTRG